MLVDDRAPLLGIDLPQKKLFTWERYITFFKPAPSWFFRFETETENTKADRLEFLAQIYMKKDCNSASILRLHCALCKKKKTAFLLIFRLYTFAGNGWSLPGNTFIVLLHIVRGMYLDSVANPLNVIIIREKFKHDALKGCMNHKPLCCWEMLVSVSLDVKKTVPSVGTM